MTALHCNVDYMDSQSWISVDLVLVFPIITNSDDKQRFRLQLREILVDIKYFSEVTAVTACDTLMKTN